MPLENNINNLSNELLNEIHSVCDEFGLNSLRKALKSVRNFAEQNLFLDMAVLGQFKAGKSSFLNCLINKSLLPVGSIPVTSVITRISYGPDEKASVTFVGGESKAIPLSEIQQYVSESGNPGNIKDVLLVDIEVPTLSNLKAVRLVDTPGIGSVWRHNTETTTSWFPETGAALFIISAERPISENELTLLQEIHSYSPEIAVVITKVDLFEEEKIKEIESFTRDVLQRSFEREFPLFRYSSFFNTSDYNREIEQKVLRPVSQNRDDVFIKVLLHKITTLVDTCLSYLEISYKSSLKLESEKSRLKEMILDEHLNSSFVRRELQLITSSYKEKTRESVRVYLDAYSKGIEEKLLSEYETAFKFWKGNLNRVTRQYETWLKETLESRLHEILISEEKSFELLNTVRKHLAFYLKSFRERLSHNLEEVLGVQLKLEDWEINLRELKRPDISISRSFDSHLDMLWFLFPMFIFRNVFRRYFAGQINYEIEKNLHRMTSDLNGKINKEIDALMTQALAYMNEELSMIETLLSENKGESHYILERINTITSRAKELQKEGDRQNGKSEKE
ncbi:MAG: hypothetical protein HPY50_02175 [Firmicutes bacterium]|nr:hypothetical protein [Bacillota bacterium]